MTRLKALLNSKRVRDQLFYFTLGILTGISLSFGLPIYPIIIFFILGLTILLSIAIILAYYRNFMEIRLLFLGASVTSVISAFITFLSITNFNFISIDINQLAGIFRSLLLASLFSLLERFARFFEDKLEIKELKTENP